MDRSRHDNPTGTPNLKRRYDNDQENEAKKMNLSSSTHDKQINTLRKKTLSYQNDYLNSCKNLETHLNEALMREYELRISKYEQQVKSLEIDAKAKKIEYQTEKEKIISDMRVRQNYKIFYENTIFYSSSVGTRAEI
jgi:hypothetical protein